MIRETPQTSSFTVSAPASVCLLGEELAPLGLRTVHMAINVRIHVKAEPLPGGFYRVAIEGEEEIREFLPSRRVGYEGLGDPLQRAVDLLAREGLAFDEGCDFQIVGDIPRDIGLGRSAAMMVSWVTALLHLHGRMADYSAQKIAMLAREAAFVDEDNPPPLVDHLISAVGGVNLVNHGSDCDLTPITRALDGLILAEVLPEGPPPCDMGPAHALVQEADQALKSLEPPVDLRVADADTLFTVLRKLPDCLSKAAYAVYVDRDLVEKGSALLLADTFDQDAFGELLDTHHEMLRDNLGVSVPQVERAVEACKTARALGCKINPACGRTALIYAPGRTQQVSAALREAAIQPWPVTKTHGVTFDD